MQKKIAILINEDFLEMRLGINTSLAYIASSIDLGYQLFIINIDNQNPFQKKLQALSIDQGDQGIIVADFKRQNDLYFSDVEAKVRTVADLNLHLSSQKVEMSEFDLVLQRLDPVNRPFPPLGEQDIDQFLLDFFDFHRFENKNFNLPVNCFKDKEFAQNIDPDMAIATKEAIDVATMAQNIVQFMEVGFAKFVIKPDNLGQSKGVFAINVTTEGLDEASLKKMTISEIQSQQIYNIKKDVGSLKETVLDLLFCESLKERQQAPQKTANDFTNDEKLRQIKKLYNSKILLQPFIAGVSKGDIRVNLAKIDNKFCLLGKVFRKPDFTNHDENFTTCVTSSAARAVDVEQILNKQEFDDLNAKIELVLQALNNEFSDKYSQCNEIGLDFIVIGDDKGVLLNEANHYCPALITLSEMVDQGVVVKSDRGLGISKLLIKSWLR